MDINRPWHKNVGVLNYVAGQGEGKGGREGEEDVTSLYLLNYCLRGQQFHPCWHKGLVSFTHQYRILAELCVNVTSS
jgi:hypothetical protein